ncbi:hypothetical protein GUJ93_ZPchr0002g23203 [Zizania palustris]|uniref:Uncharacterized protein n=1 Tax=Zizania palustris TaxID=103762 RepID=A0A8J5SF82_ZIZPA|nr:hypothetical protein GUJ93_ZPchr0002g23203 [Zizania palustris]
MPFHLMSVASIYPGTSSLYKSHANLSSSLCHPLILGQNHPRWLRSRVVLHPMRHPLCSAMPMLRIVVSCSLSDYDAVEEPEYFPDVPPSPFTNQEPVYYEDDKGLE